MKTFTRICDPSHSWLRVPLAEIERLGIADQISNFSYQKGKYAFLEEDRDMAIFVKAREDEGKPIRILEHHNKERMSRIRKYPMFAGDRLVTKTNFMTGKEFQEQADTPYYCSPSSETYWSS